MMQGTMQGLCAGPSLGPTRPLNAFSKANIINPTTDGQEPKPRRAADSRLDCPEKADSPVWW